jgi:hypothetical protein
VIIFAALFGGKKSEKKYKKIMKKVRKNFGGNENFFTFAILKKSSLKKLI